MNKDAVYVLEQPKHSIVTVVLINSAKLPLSNTAHQNIDSLREIFQNSPTYMELVLTSVAQER